MDIFGVVLSILRMRQNSLNLFAELDIREIPAPAPAVSYSLCSLQLGLHVIVSAPLRNSPTPSLIHHTLT